MTGTDAGVLVVVATPIGNLGDLAPRAMEVLRAAELIACEDTRRTGRLLSAFGIRARRLVAVHEHNEASMVPSVLARLEAGDTVALVSDAGTPTISDPGERLVRAAADRGFRVQAVPGPSAAVTALVVSGLPAGRWCFEGFLPRKGAERSARLAALAAEPRTMVFYEAPHRLARTLADLSAAVGAERRVAVARELTKLFEETWRGTLGAAVERVNAGDAPRGEHVIVVDGAPPPPPAGDDEIAGALAAAVAAGADRRTAVANVAASLGVPKRRVYDLALTYRP